MDSPAGRFFVRLSLGLFVLFLAHGLAGVALGPARERIRATEFRTAEEFPPLRFGPWQELPGKLRAAERAFSDRVLFRTEQMSALARLYYHLGVELVPERVVFGRGDWFYLGNFFQEAMDKYRGLRIYSNEELRKRVALLRKRKKFCAGLGIPFLFTVVPDKQTGLPEFLPSWASVVNPARNRTLLQQQAKRLGIPFLDLTPAVRNAREEALPYYRGDSHWNKVGAYYGFKAIFGELRGLDPGLVWPENAAASLMPDVEPPATDLLRLSLLGDVALPADDAMRIWFPAIPDDTQISRALADGTTSQMPLAPGYYVADAPVVFKNPAAANKKTVLLFRDSFASNLHPYFAALFSTVIEARHEGVKEKTFEALVRSHQPDIVVWEIAERLL